MYISLYRKYRPQTFSDMVGQSAAVSVLQESLKENKLGHAYLFPAPEAAEKLPQLGLWRRALTVRISLLTTSHAESVPAVSASRLANIWML